jgi:hypothetical protein
VWGGGEEEEEKELFLGGAGAGGAGLVLQFGKRAAAVSSACWVGKLCGV